MVPGLPPPLVTVEKRSRKRCRGEMEMGRGVRLTTSSRICYGSGPPLLPRVPAGPTGLGGRRRPPAAAVAATHCSTGPERGRCRCLARQCRWCRRWPLNFSDHSPAGSRKITLQIKCRYSPIAGSFRNLRIHLIIPSIDSSLASMKNASINPLRSSLPPRAPWCRRFVYS